MRTRDEETNIERFCRAYQWTDKILIADGGSEDNTISLAKSLPKTEIRHFLGREEMENGYWRNPQAEHINFLIDWAKEEQADWIFFDDCDCIPNIRLIDEIKEILERTENDFIYATRLYLWKENKYFPKLSRNDQTWTPGLWGWRGEAEIEFYNAPPTFSFKPTHPLYERLNLLPPYCLLHRPWLNNGIIDKKLDFYRNSKQHPNMLHPTKIGGKIEDLPEWAKEKENK